MASQLRRAGYDALVVKGRASEPTVLVVRDGEVRFEPAGVSASWKLSNIDSGAQLPQLFLRSMSASVPKPDAAPERSR